MNKKHVFLASYGAGHANIIRIVKNQLLNDKSFELTTLALTTAPLVYDAHRIEYQTLSEVAKCLPDYDEIKKLGYEIGRKYHNTDLGIKLEDTLLYYGIGYRDLVQEFGEEQAKEKFNREGRKIFLPVKTMEKILMTYKPDVVVVTTSPRYEKAMGLAANNLDIPVVQILDLPMLEADWFKADICVMNEWSKEYILANYSIPEDRIFITGQPVFEEELKIADFEKEMFLDKILDHGRYSRLVVFFTRCGYDETNTLKMFDEIAINFPNDLFVIKLHPNQVENAIYEPKSKNVIKTKEEARLFVTICTVAITAFSTTGLESALLGKPLIEVKMNNEVYSMDYYEMGIASLAQTKDELQSQIAFYLSEEETEELNMDQRKKFVNHTNAAYNICEVIRKTCLKPTKDS